VKEESAKKAVSVFSWEAVDPVVIKAMLKTAYVQAGRSDQVAEIKKMSDSAVRFNAAKWLGTPPQKKLFTSAMINELRQRWLPNAPPKIFDELIAKIQLTVGGESRSLVFNNKASRVAFVRNRTITVNLIANIRRAFLASHKVKRAVDVGSPQDQLLAGPVQLIGAGEPLEFEWYPHQQESQRKLDKLWANGELHGRLVLPTGAGKTDTVAAWLLKQMSTDSKLRVLWLVHQQELAAQAVSRFQALARSQEVGFERRARTIYTGANALSTLADDKVALGAVTYQSFRKFDASKRKLLKRFLARPTIVVIDEAHHAGAPTFESLLDAICAEPNVEGVLGLTATPYPAGAAAYQRFLTRFPRIVHEVSVFDLVRDGILARPFVTTFDTNLRFEMTDQQIKTAESADFPTEVLAQLDNENRDALIIKAWQDSAKRWGKTLLFATTIHHADSLTHQLQNAGAEARALHSQTPDRREPLTWFRKRPTNSSSVLVSVGMLTEGVDLPDARTAFLARPTTSRILMRQMVGRVLRGPQAGGEATAHVVYFRDDWRQLPDVLQPEEVLPAMSGATDTKDGLTWAPGDLATDAELIQRVALAAQVARALARLRAMFKPDDLDPFHDTPLDPLLREARIVGFYRVDDQQFPVLDHQKEPLARLLEDAATGKLSRVPFLSYFEDGPPPYPARRMLGQLVDVAREFQEAPELKPLDISVSPRSLAQRVLHEDLGARETASLVEAAYADPLARVLFRSSAALHEAVERALLQLLRPVPLPEAEQSIVVAIDPAKLPKLKRSERDLEALLLDTVNIARTLVPGSVADRLVDPPKIGWTKRVVRSSFAHWSLKLVHANQGRPVIRVNRLLRAPKYQVPDEVLQFLIYHEILHNLLPGQGHDSEFREYEADWPGAIDNNLWLYTVHEKWDTRPDSYGKDVA
jgi:superfamily II DNA or RNA helicase